MTISVTFSLGVNYLFTFIHEHKEEVMFLLSALVAYVWSGVAFLWRPGGSLPHARGGTEGGAVSWSKRDVREVRFLPSTPLNIRIAPNRRFESDAKPALRAYFRAPQPGR